jgi:hypothetical protein
MILELPITTSFGFRIGTEPSNLGTKVQIVNDLI